MPLVPRRPVSTITRLFGDIAISAFVAVVVFGAIQWWHGPDNSAGLTIGEPPPAFELLDLHTGTAVGLADLVGRPVVLNFWATWCVPCQAEMPALEQLSRTAGTRLHVVTITEDDPNEVRRFLNHGGYSLRCLMDRGGTISGRYKVRSLPRTVVLDARGHVVRDIVGQVDMAVLREALGHAGR